MATREHTTLYPEIEVSVSYLHTPGYRASRMDPGAPDEAIVTGFSLDFGHGLMINHEQLPKELSDALALHIGKHYHEELVADVAGPDPDYANDLRREDRMLGVA